MTPKSGKIELNIHCNSSAEKIFHLLDSNEGRKNFWAETAEEINGNIHFTFPNGQQYASKIVSKTINSEFSIIYFDTLLTIQLLDSKDNGTDVKVIHLDVMPEDYDDTKAGWVSVLLALKAFADYGIDLRNHSKEKNWNTGFVDN